MTLEAVIPQNLKQNSFALSESNSILIKSRLSQHLRSAWLTLAEGINPHPMNPVTIGRVKFTITSDGRVSSPDYPDLGNVEDCQAFAELVNHLFDTLYPGFNI